MNAKCGVPSPAQAPRRRTARMLVCAMLAGTGALGACGRDLPAEPQARRAAPGGVPAMDLYDNPLCQEPPGTVHPGDTLTASEQWGPSGNPHHVTGAIHVHNGARLRLLAGTLVCFESQAGIRADQDGWLVVDGDATARVVLTALHPSLGWEGISLHGTPAASSALVNTLVEYVSFGTAVHAQDRHVARLDSVHIRQAGHAATLYSPLSRIMRSWVDTTGSAAVVMGDSTRFDKTVVRGAGGAGVHVVGTAGVLLVGGRIEGSADVGVRVEHSGAVSGGDGIRITGGSSYPLDVPVDALSRMYGTAAEQDSLLGNARDTLYVRGGTLTSWVYAVAALPWRVTGHLAISTDGQLRAQPGALFVVQAPWGITAQNGGRLLARGAHGTPVRFTAADSTLGWAGILLKDAPTSASYLTNAHVEYVPFTSALFARDNHKVLVDSAVFRRVAQAVALASPSSRIIRSRIDSTTVTGAAAVELASTASLESTLIRGAAGMGIYMHTSTARVFSCEIRDSGGDAIVLGPSGAAPVHHCNLVNNAGYGISNGSSTTADATDNWWGDAAGPSGPNGDGAFGVLSYTPWRTTPYVLPYVP